MINAFRYGRLREVRPAQPSATATELTEQTPPFPKHPPRLVHVHEGKRAKRRAPFQRFLRRGHQETNWNAAPAAFTNACAEAAASSARAAIVRPLAAEEISVRREGKPNLKLTHKSPSGRSILKLPNGNKPKQEARGEFPPRGACRIRVLKTSRRRSAVHTTGARFPSIRLAAPRAAPVGA